MDTNVEILKKEQKIEELLNEVFSILNVEKTDSNVDTPKRIAKMWVREVFRNNVDSEHLKYLKETIKTFPYNSGLADTDLIITTVPFHAFCEHHLLPFSGKIQLGYVPTNEVIGLSKIPRIVDFWCHTPQLQEKLGIDILQTFIEFLDPKFACVRVIAEHSCVACRGIERECCTDTFNSYSRDIDVNEKYYVESFFRRVGNTV